MLRNRGRVVLLLVATLGVSLAVPGVVAGQDDVTLTVTVVDSDGERVGGIDLEATWDGGGPVEETTRSNGQALIDVPEGENVTITVHDDDYVRNSEFVVEDASTREVEIPVTEAGSTTVTVVDGDGPVSNAIVQMSRDGTFVVNTRTNSEGEVTSGDIEQGDYSATVWRRGYLRNKTTLTVDGDVSHEVRIEEGSRLMTVTVVDDHFSPAEPVRDAEVSVERRGTVSTLSNGDATMQVPVNADYEVSVTKDGYETNSTTVDVRESEVAVNLTINREDAINLETSNQRVVVGETVRLTVSDEYGDPVTDVTVERDGEALGETGADGTLTVTVDEAGTHNLTATSDGLEANATVEGVSSGSDVEDTPSESETASDPTETATSDGSGPGFTAVTVLAALVGLTLLVRRR